MSDLPACISMHHMPAVPLEPEEGIRSPGTRVIDGCEPPGVFATEPGSTARWCLGALSTKIYSGPAI